MCLVHVFMWLIFLSLLRKTFQPLSLRFCVVFTHEPFLRPGGRVRSGWLLKFWASSSDMVWSQEF